MLCSWFICEHIFHCFISGWMWQFYWVHLWNNLWGQPHSPDQKIAIIIYFWGWKQNKKISMACANRNRRKKNDVVCFSRLHIIDQSVESLIIKNSFVNEIWPDKAHHINIAHINFVPISGSNCSNTANNVYQTYFFLFHLPLLFISMFYSFHS